MLKIKNTQLKNGKLRLRNEQTMLDCGFFKRAFEDDGNYDVPAPFLYVFDIDMLLSFDSHP